MKCMRGWWGGKRCPQFRGVLIEGFRVSATEPTSIVLLSVSLSPYKYQQARQCL